MTHPLDNPVWHALNGPHRSFARRHGLALHYPREVAAFSAIAEASAQAFADLALGLPPDTEARLVRARIESIPEDWQLVNDVPLLQMELRAIDGRPRRRGHRHAGAAAARRGDGAGRTDAAGSLRPAHAGDGPLHRRVRTRPVAGDGRRAHSPGRARRAQRHLHPRRRAAAAGRRADAPADARRAAARAAPFLHVLPSNTGAIALYRRLGFVTRAEMHYRWCRPLRTVKSPA